MTYVAIVSNIEDSHGIVETEVDKNILTAVESELQL